jgi:hypothetical protein
VVECQAALEAAQEGRKTLRPLGPARSTCLHSTCSGPPVPAPSIRTSSTARW